MRSGGWDRSPACAAAAPVRLADQSRVARPRWIAADGMQRDLQRSSSVDGLGHGCRGLIDFWQVAEDKMPVELMRRLFRIVKRINA